jgi:hypothetical protein
MSDEQHSYPSNYPPGTHWAIDVAWDILDRFRPGVISFENRALLAGMITSALMRERRWAKPVEGNSTVWSASGQAMTETLADQLQRLCCAETESKFFDCVTDNIDQIIAALSATTSIKTNHSS